MIDPLNIPPLDEAELLTRFILQSNEKRDDGTVKPKLFLPYQFVELSVNRLRDATPDETWNIGRSVALTRRGTLYGRADIRVSACRLPPLEVTPDPLPGNANHANIIGFPDRKDEQLSLAQKLAAAIEGCWIAAPGDVEP